MIEKVIKRHGFPEKFSREKLEKSLRKALTHYHGKNHSHRSIARTISGKIEKAGRGSVHSTSIRNFVVKELKSMGLENVVSHYDLVFFHLPECRLKQILKRSGKTEQFDAKKLYKSLRKSFSNAWVGDGIVCEKITQEVIKKLEKRFGEKTVPVESIRDTAEQTLLHHGLSRVARVYVLHRFM